MNEDGDNKVYVIKENDNKVYHLKELNAKDQPSFEEVEKLKNDKQMSPQKNILRHNSDNSLCTDNENIYSSSRNDIMVKLPSMVASKTPNMSKHFGSIFTQWISVNWYLNYRFTTRFTIQRITASMPYAWHQRYADSDEFK